MKKIIALCLVLCLAVSLAACGGNSDPTIPSTNLENKKDPGSFNKEVSWNVLEHVDEAFPFDEYVADEKEKWNLGREASLDAWFQFDFHRCTQSLDEYSTLKVVKEITGIDMIGRRSAGSYQEAVNMMMATGQFPDMLTLAVEDPLIDKLIAGGFVYSIDELMERYEPGMKEELPERVVEASTYADGKIWFITGQTVANTTKETNMYYNANQAYNVRHDIWEALGKPSIATPEDLYNTLKLFKERYPTLNGQDSIALGGYGVNGICTLFTIGHSWNLGQILSIDQQTGTVNSRYLDPNYAEFVAFMNKLNREGLLDPEFFTKDTQQQIEGAANNTFMIPWMWHALDTANSTLMQTDPNSIFVGIEPMSATDAGYSFPGSSRMGGAAVTLIPKRASDPEAAIRMIRYGLSAAGSLQFLRGNPGEHYTVDDGAVDFSDSVKQAIAENETRFYADSGMADYGNLVYVDLTIKQSYTDLRNKYDLPNSFPYAYDPTAETYRMTPALDSPAGIAYNTINAIGVRETSLAIIAPTAEESAQIIRDMQEEIRNTADYDTLVEFWTQQYKSNLERFGGPQWGPNVD